MNGHLFLGWGQSEKKPQLYFRVLIFFSDEKEILLFVNFCLKVIDLVVHAQVA